MVQKENLKPTDAASTNDIDPFSGDAGKQLRELMMMADGSFDDDEDSDEDEAGHPWNYYYDGGLSDGDLSSFQAFATASLQDILAKDFPRDRVATCFEPDCYPERAPLEGPPAVPAANRKPRRIVQAKRQTRKATVEQPQKDVSLGDVPSVPALEIFKTMEPAVSFQFKAEKKNQEDVKNEDMVVIGAAAEAEAVKVPVLCSFTESMYINQRVEKEAALVAAAEGRRRRPAAGSAHAKRNVIAQAAAVERKAGMDSTQKKIIPSEKVATKEAVLVTGSTAAVVRSLPASGDSSQITLQKKVSSVRLTTANFDANDLVSSLMGLSLAGKEKTEQECVPAVTEIKGQVQSAVAVQKVVLPGRVDSQESPSSLDGAMSKNAYGSASSKAPLAESVPKTNAPMAFSFEHMQRSEQASFEKSPAPWTTVEQQQGRALNSMSSATTGKKNRN